MNDRDVLLPEQEVLRQTAVSKTTIWRLERQGRFPKRIRISPRRVGWLQSEVDAWINERIAERGAS